MQKTRRRVYLIDKRLQLRFTALVVALVVVYSLFLGGATYINYRISSIVFDNSSIYDPVLEESIKAEGRRTVFVTTSFLVVNGIVVGLALVLLTHKVAGPLYRIRMHFGAIRDGKIPQQLQLRKNDELTNVAQSFNEMTQVLRCQVEKDAAEIEEMAVGVRELAEALRKSGQCADAAAKATAVAEKMEASGKAKRDMLA
jgi:methyl-accepting chemotaxis protein